MKILVLLLLLSIPLSSKPVAFTYQITKQGANLKVIEGARVYTYPIGSFEIYRQSSDFIRIQRHIIKDYTTVTEPASTSLADLHNKLNTLIQ